MAACHLYALLTLWETTRRKRNPASRANCASRAIPYSNGLAHSSTCLSLSLFLSLECSYYKREDATREAFDAQGWFRTGDVSACVDGIYRILGRASVDIIKSGGYKVQKLEDMLAATDG
jgi:hypothetical protein